MDQNNEAKIFIRLLCNVKRKIFKYTFPMSKGFATRFSAASAFQNIYYAKHVWKEFEDKAAIKM